MHDGGEAACFGDVGAVAGAVDCWSWIEGRGWIVCAVGVVTITTAVVVSECVVEDEEVGVRCWRDGIGSAVADGIGTVVALWGCSGDGGDAVDVVDGGIFAWKSSGGGCAGAWQAVVVDARGLLIFLSEYCSVGRSRITICGRGV